MNRKKMILVWLVLVCFSMSCSGANLFATPTPIPTPTPEGQRISVPGGGYSLIIPLEAVYAVSDRTVQITYPSGGVGLVTNIWLVDTRGRDQVSLIRDALQLSAGEGDEVYLGDSAAIVVGGLDGLAIELTGFLSGTPVEGILVGVTLDDEHFFLGYGVADISSDPNLWSGFGRDYVLDILATVEFARE
ncbi:MAG: hypothetical protein JXB85_02520 [Anaerolineales bacterium]|nr:hypothetical protein [Anaerolineales bacterium]